ncbi:MAG: ankyrin repeat domain-containing protein [Gammaproteobacteria bacterium]
MAKSRKDLLTERTILGNSLLLEAIANNDTDTALAYIHADLKANDGQTIINESNIGNTPLLLALKTGNIRVANELLNHPKIDVNAQDEHQFTALHWACMLRQDDIIKKLLQKGADPTAVVPQWVESIYEEKEISPANLYEDDVFIDNFRAYIQAAQAVMYINKNHRNPESKQTLERVNEMYYYSPYKDVFGLPPRDYKPPYKDRSDLYIPGSMAYTNLIFFIKDICNNLHWTSDKTQFKSLESKDYTSSHQLFEYNFSAGIKDFCTARNALPINHELLSELRNFKKPGRSFR